MAIDYALQGQVAVVTGSTSGIGQAMASALAEQGVNIILNGFGDPAQIETDRRALEARTGIRALYHGADMTKPAEIDDLVDTARREFGRLDILVNNAGIQHVAAVEEFPVEKWDAVIAINMSSVFHATKAAVPIMKAQGRGRIVNIASAHGLVASPFKSAYVAAKHGVVGFTKSVALELAREGGDLQRHLPRLREDAVGGKADRRPGPHPRHSRRPGGRGGDPCRAAQQGLRQL